MRAARSAGVRVLVGFTVETDGRLPDGTTRGDAVDTGDLDLLARTYDDLRPLLPGLRVVGGCCGTDARHVAALWGV